MGTVVFNYDVSKKVTEKYKSKTFQKIDAATVSLEIDDKVMDALEKSKDRDLASIKMVEKGQKLCEATTAALIELLKKLDEESEKEGDDAKRKKLVQDYRSGQQKQLDDLKKS